MVSKKLHLGAGTAVALTALLCAPQPITAQNRNSDRDRDSDRGRYSDRDRDPYADRYRNGRYDAYSPVAELEPGTTIDVRIEQPIDTNQRDGRVYSAVVQDDVWDSYSRLAVPMIPRGSPAELLVHQSPDGDLVLDLESVTVKGQRYGVSSSAERVVGTRGREEDRHDRNTPAYVGGGALLGTIIGAIAGGGKGAAIGAAGGAAAGAGAAVMTKGHDVRVPTGSVVTFRLDEPLSIGARDTGYQRGDYHYHR